MTTDRPAPDNQPSGITLPMFILAAVVLIAGVMAAIWFVFPAPDNLHNLISPSGTKVIELGELCGDTQCNRVAILDVTQHDGTHIRTGCPLSLSGSNPLFASVTATWSAAEDRVDIGYAPENGPAGTLGIITAQCTQTR